VVAQEALDLFDERLGADVVVFVVEAALELLDVAGGLLVLSNELVELTLVGRGGDLEVGDLSGLVSHLILLAKRQKRKGYVGRCGVGKREIRFRRFRSLVKSEF
jgi:hypothetical protein